MAVGRAAQARTVGCERRARADWPTSGSRQARNADVFRSGHSETDPTLQPLYRRSLTSTTNATPDSPVKSTNSEPSNTTSGNQNACSLRQRGRVQRRSTHLGLEAKHAQNRRRGHLDVDAVAMVLELQVAHLVHQQTLERGVEERHRLEPLQEPRKFVAVDEQTRKEQTVAVSIAREGGRGRT